MNRLKTPEALLFDMDDTLADVTGSYRGAVIETAKTYGITVTFDDITEAKAKGDANNEWVMTRRMLNERGIDSTLEEVTRRFEEFYQGTESRPGFKLKETLLIEKDELENLALKFKMGVVTGRPRKDAMEFLVNNKIDNFFQTVVTMDDAPLKPNPEPVKLALSRLGVNNAWLFGDTPDDIRSAVSAGIIGIGVIAPSDDPKKAEAILKNAGATRVIANLTQIKDLLA